MSDYRNHSKNSLRSNSFSCRFTCIAIAIQESKKIPIIVHPLKTSSCGMFSRTTLTGSNNIAQGLAPTLADVTTPMPLQGANNNYEPLTGALIIRIRIHTGASPCARLLNPFGVYIGVVSVNTIARPLVIKDLTRVPRYQNGEKLSVSATFRVASSPYRGRPWRGWMSLGSFSDF